MAAIQQANSCETGNYIFDNVTGLIKNVVFKISLHSSTANKVLAKIYVLGYVVNPGTILEVSFIFDINY